MARKLCARALEIKANYERSTPNTDEANNAERAAVYKGSRFGDRRAMARALEGHTRRCPLCT